MGGELTPESLFKEKTMKNKLRVPCSYQGGKQRIAQQIVDELLYAAPDANTRFYDLCCGSGAISIELVNRGVSPSDITMLDLSSWAAFWQAIGTGAFDKKRFDDYLVAIPDDKRKVKGHMEAVVSDPEKWSEAEIYPILQAVSFGGKQIWKTNNKWENAFFRDYWEPTATSVRRSPANPMQPSPEELRRRVFALAESMQGITCIRANILLTLELEIPANAVVYVDPPYSNTTGYGFHFDINDFALQFVRKNKAALFISEGKQLSQNATQLAFGGAKGGINGSRVGKHQEWLNRYF